MSFRGTTVGKGLREEVPMMWVHVSWPNMQKQFLKLPQILQIHWCTWICREETPGTRDGCSCLRRQQILETTAWPKRSWFWKLISVRLVCYGLHDFDLLLGDIKTVHMKHSSKRKFSVCGSAISKNECRRSSGHSTLKSTLAWPWLSPASSRVCCYSQTFHQQLTEICILIYFKTL